MAEPVGAYLWLGWAALAGLDEVILLHSSSITFSSAQLSLAFFCRSLLGFNLCRSFLHWPQLLPTYALAPARLLNRQIDTRAQQLPFKRVCLHPRPVPAAAPPTTTPGSDPFAPPGDQVLRQRNRAGLLLACSSASFERSSHTLSLLTMLKCAQHGIS